MIEEQVIIQRCLDGDAEQYAVLVDRYKDMVFNIAYRMLGDEDAANDMAQESFISAYEGLRGFRFGSKFSSWLYRIVMNKCRDYWRAGKKALSIDDIREVTPGADPTPEQIAASGQAGDAVQRALGTLPAEYREVIILKHLEGLDYREIADILGVEVAALKVRAHRGREKLRRILEEMGVTA
jgi:RNA polymerase sigma-70 factor (ECF subfamily)